MIFAYLESDRYSRGGASRLWKFLSAAFLLVCVVQAFGESTRSEAIALLLRTEKTALHSSDEIPSAYHEHVNFTLFENAGEIKGQFIRDYLSPQQWRERYELGEYLHILVRNGQEIGEFESSAFEPIHISQLRRFLPPVFIRLENGDIVKKLTSQRIHKIEGKCVEYETLHGQNHEANEVCVSVASSTLIRLRQRTTEGVCAFGCGMTETAWTDYASLGDRLYPRHVIVKYGVSKIIEADIQFTPGKDLTPDLFRIPNNLEIKRACNQTAPPVRIQGEIPNYPQRINQFPYEGTVLVQARIGVDGHVQAAQVVHPRPFSSIFALNSRDVDRTVIDSVRKWTFEPGTCDGVPTIQNILIPFKAEVR